MRPELTEILTTVLEVPSVSDRDNADTIASWDSVRHLTLITALEERFGPLPEEPASRIRASTDSEQLDRWMGSAVAVTVSTLDQFRQKAGI